MADYYNRMTVDVSRRPVGFLLEKANERVPFSEATAILDNGCGPGPIMGRLLQDYDIPDSAAITCADFSEGMIKQVHKRQEEAVKADGKSPWSRVETLVQDAMNLDKIEDGSKSHVTAGWVGHFEIRSRARTDVRAGLLHDARSPEVSY